MISHFQLFKIKIIKISFNILIVPPKIAPFSFGETPMNYEETVSVTCTISGGDTPISVIWKFNEVIIENDNMNDVILEKRGKRVNNLIIESVTHRHIGNYTCSASNKAGVVEFTSQLFVNGLSSIFWLLIDKINSCRKIS